TAAREKHRASHLHGLRTGEHRFTKPRGKPADLIARWDARSRPSGTSSGLVGRFIPRRPVDRRGAGARRSTGDCKNPPSKDMKRSEKYYAQGQDRERPV